ncbi:MAG: polysaccharide biosynthesis C-terminal domain-containing protein [Candidatus Acidiferrales bacterium]
MNPKETAVVAKNAAANVVRGCATAAVALALPAFLTRLMSIDSYGVWSLVLQMSAFVSYLDFGIQTAIGRFVAHAAERKDTEQRDRILSTALAALGISGAMGIVAAGGLAVVMPSIFHSIPHELLAQARVALLLVAGSMAVGLPFSVFNGIFVGLQRYEIPAAVIGVSRLFSAAVLILVAREHGGLLQMAVAVAVVNFGAYGTQYLLYRWLAPRARFSSELVSRRSGHELFDYCFSLSIWSLGMLLVSGFDITLVGYFDFGKIAYYSVAATLILFLGGLQNAIFSTLIPSTAVVQARGDAKQLGQIVVTATRYGMFLLLLTGLPLIFAARPILNLWVGQQYAVGGALILEVLTIANVIRLCGLPYSAALIGTGQQRLATVTPILEGVCNFLVSIAAGYLFGAIGVALGTLVGAIVGILGHIFYNLPRTREIRLKVLDFLKEGLLRPTICALPIIAVATALWLAGVSSPMVARPAVVLGATATAVLLWRYGLLPSERDKLRLSRLVALW